jgi:Flp pilus assembly pilin Flp
MIYDINHEVITTRPGTEGQTMTEYALILAAVAIVAIVGYLALGSAVTTLINNVVKCL